MVAKGKAQPVAVWEAVEPRARLGVDLGGAPGAPLVGRDDELDLLVDALRRSRRDRSTQLVTLVGVPGIGKSRLVLELGRVVDDDADLITWRQGRCLPYGDGVSYWALGEIVKAHAGILESDSGDVADTKLAAILEAVADEGERGWVGRHLRPLVGLGRVEESGDVRGEAFAAWRRFLEAMAERGPVVLVFEDLHWADDGLLDFVDGLVDWVDRVPLLVVCTARPELLERRPGWGGGKRNASTVSLAALDDDATARLVLSLLDRPLLDAETQQELVARAGGNPLYAEEFVRMLQAGAGVDERLPETVQGTIAARIDLLPAAEKDLLQTAAVLGKVFWSDALLSAVGAEPWQLAEMLRALERKEFVRREHRSAVAGATQHAFVHALVRDAAYTLLPRPARAQRHLAAAEWIESLPEDRAEDRAETLAHHYLTAIDLRRAAGDDVSELGPRAVKALEEAGERAIALSAYNTAASFLARALDLLPPDVEPSAELLFHAGTAFSFMGRQTDELARAVDAFERAGDPERAAEAAVAASWHTWHSNPIESGAWLERATALLDGRPPSRAKALMLAERARILMINYQYETSLPVADEAIQQARAVGDVQIEADAIVTSACSRAMLGDRQSMELFEQALALVGHRGRVASRAHTNLGVAWSVFGDLQRATEVSVRGIAIAERDGDEQSAAFMRGNLMGVQFERGEWDDALTHANVMLGTVGWPRLRPFAHAIRAWSASPADGAWTHWRTWRLRSRSHARSRTRRFSGRRWSPLPASSGGRVAARTRRAYWPTSSMRSAAASRSGTCRNGTSTSRPNFARRAATTQGRRSSRESRTGRGERPVSRLSMGTTPRPPTSSRRWGASDSRRTSACGPQGRSPPPAGSRKRKRSSTSRVPSSGRSARRHTWRKPTRSSRPRADAAPGAGRRQTLTGR